MPPLDFAWAERLPHPKRRRSAHLMSCCAARPKNKRAASSPALLLGKEADNGLLEIRKAPKPKEKMNYAVEDYNRVPALTIPTESPDTVLSLAARGDVRALKFVIDAKSDEAKALANEPHLETGTTPLLAAAKSGHNRCIEVLLEHGADVNQANKEGWTPLMAAVRFADRDTTRCAKLDPGCQSPNRCVLNPRMPSAGCC